MSRRIINVGLALLLGVVLTLPAFAQGVQTGTLNGTIKAEDGSLLPGVTVTATSPSMQGSRTVISGGTGSWVLRNLPPGDYTVTFELEGMGTVQSSVKASLGRTTPLNIEMSVAVQEETIIVTGETPGVLADSQVSTVYSFEEVNNLPIFGRSPQAIAQLSPGLSTNTPNAGQLTISGGFAYDNVFLIDGVDANDNLFGTAGPTFIEDAIADLQVLTSGISSEYGRFTGGVINVITKSGGNEFSGTVRRDLSNSGWRERNGLEVQNDADEPSGPTSELDSATLGGYFLKDKIWFFGARRENSSSDLQTFSVTGLPKPTSQVQDRTEIKLTGNIQDKHQIQVQDTDRTATGVRSSFGFSNTPQTLRTRTDPATLQVQRYSGVLTSSIFAELQLSEKTFQFNNTHGKNAPSGAAAALNADGTVNQAFVADSPFFDFFASGTFSHWNAPYFDGSDPEDRNNEQLAASLSYFLDSASSGSHDLKFGYEDFSSFRTGGNSQSPTDFVMSSDVVVDADGNVILGPNNEPTADWIPGASGAWNFIPNRNAEIELNTESFYVNDRWQLNDHWSFNLGFRAEDVGGKSDTGIVTVDTDALVPRMAASYDLRGDGKHRFDVTYAEYAGKYSESQFAANTDVGNPPGLAYIFIGPAGTGLDYAPAFDFNNTLGNNYVIVGACDGTQNIFVADGLSSPTVEEVTLAYGTELKRGGFLKLVYTDRSYKDFVEDFVQVASTEIIVQGVSAGTFSNVIFDNTNALSRDYQALQAIFRYRLTDNWTVDANFTHQLKNEGNFEGEGTNTPGSSSIFGDYQEALIEESHFPVANLDDYQENRVRAWTNYNLDMGRGGNLNFGLLVNFDSGRSLEYVDTNVPLTQLQRDAIALAGYVDRLTTSANDIKFNGQTQDFGDSTTFNMSVNYQLPLFKDIRVWLKADMINIFNDDSQISGEDDVVADFNGPLNTLGLPTTFNNRSDTGDAKSTGHFVAPREYRFTVGFRF